MSSSLELSIQHRISPEFSLEVSFCTPALITSVFGPSGSGKTSLLSMIAGLSTPQEGRIVLGNRILLDTAVGVNLPPEKRRIGYIFQDYLLFPHLSVEKNLCYGIPDQGGAHNGIELKKVVEILELQPLLHKFPARLSGGEKQRIALGRALLSSPQLLLMDEPLSSLDETLREKILNYLEAVLAEWKIPTIYVSHNLAEVSRLAQHVVVIKSGKKIAAGTPQQIFAKTDLALVAAGIC